MDDQEWMAQLAAFVGTFIRGSAGASREESAGRYETSESDIVSQGQCQV